MQKTVDEITVLKALRDARDYFDAQPKSEVYNSKKTGFKDIETGYVFNSREDFLNTLHKIGIQGKTLKEAGGELEEWYESLLQTQETITEIPQYEAQTTTTGLDLETKVEQAEKRSQQKADIQAREKQTIEDFIKQSEERIAKAKSIQEKLKDKVVYAKVIIPEPLPLNEVEKQDLSTLREYAQGNEETRKKLIDDLEKQIETKLDNVATEQKELIARTAAVEIVEKLAKPETAYANQIQNSILTAIHEDKGRILQTVLQKDDDLLITAKEGSILLELEAHNKELTTKTIAKNIFGEKLTLAIYGPEKFQIILTETKTEGQTTHEVNLGRLNQNHISALEHQNSTLNTIKEFGIGKTQSYFTGQARTYVAEKMASMPAGSIIKKTYSDPIVQTIFARYGLANPVVWQTVSTNQFVGLAMRFAPDTAGPVLGFAGRMTGIEFVTPITTFGGGAVGATIAAQAATTYTSVAITGGVFAAEAFAGGVGSAAAGAAAGSIVPGVGTIIGAVAGAVGGELLKPIFSKLKVWWTNNKDSLAPALGIGAGFLIAPFFGAGPAVLGGVGAFALFGGSVARLATGAFGVLGLVGRSVGIAIATPVIVTLLVLPPLVAFIILVINNSAYVVPPSFSDNATIPPPLIGGLVSSCEENDDTGAEITNDLARIIRNGSVKLLPETVWGRRDGICIKPTMIVMHWSGGTNNNPDGNQRTYETLVARNLSCQLATDTNDTWLMERFFEKAVEFPACAGSYNTYSINNEMAGVYFTANPPPPNIEELELTYDVTCKVMDQYDIPWTQIRGHYHVPNSGKSDPGKDFLERVFIPEIRQRCPND